VESGPEQAVPLRKPGRGPSVPRMNEAHAQLCSSPEWAEYLRTEVLSSVAAEIEFGAEMLEVGPGPGAATEWLRSRVPRLVAVESDEDAAMVLAERYAGTNVEILHADATALPFPPASFDSAASFTMLHHVPTVVLQNRLLTEILRVLRPGGVLVGSDSLPSDELHHFHEGDTYNPIEPGAFLTRLQTLGFANIAIAINAEMRFVARKPE
jgi:SAM-dependent methyltransferase